MDAERSHSRSPPRLGDDRRVSASRAAPERLYVEAKALGVSLFFSRGCRWAVGTRRKCHRFGRVVVRKAHEARDLVDSRLEDLPSLSDLARAVGMSTTALKRAYRMVFGIPVYETRARSASAEPGRCSPKGISS